jgi:hypothetical protein
MKQEYRIVQNGLGQWGVESKFTHERHDTVETSWCLIKSGGRHREHVRTWDTEENAIAWVREQQSKNEHERLRSTWRITKVMGS